MNAIQPNVGERDSEALRRAQRSHEPSMEEILASIRAIIADDRDALPPRPAAPSGPQIVYSNDQPSRAEEESASADVAPVVSAASSAEIDEAPATVAAAPSSPPDAPAAAPVAPMVVWARPRIEPRPAPAPEPAAPVEPEAVAETAPRREPEPPAEESPLLSEDADRAVSASFGVLSASIAMQNAELVDRLTREMLRPMIKTWLDEHLPSLVERLVRAEIQRVARGGR